ncbi:DUF932 domain-containing protein [Actinomadura scrupuli]|uniref:DUF932 domain-containing protein n=1 Tax=Actinomadura scrupuli TaxID=559629 RepID=UPI003D97BD1A
MVQNEEVADFLQALVDESGAIFHTGGSLNSGRRVFVTMKLPDHLMVGGIDAVDLYIAAFSRHDGWGSFTTVATPVRVVCANTERAALRNHRSIFKVRHTGHIAGRIAEAREALKLSWKHGQAFAAEAEQLLATPMEVKEFRQFTGALLPLPQTRACWPSATTMRRCAPWRPCSAPPPTSVTSGAPAGRPTTP